MKKNLIAVAVLASSVFAVTAAAAADGQINFTGVITDDACVVTNSPSDPLNVPMGTVASTSFKDTSGNPSADVTSDATVFKILLTGCPIAATRAAVKFDGVSVSGNNSILALTPGGATGVGIQLSDDANTVVPLYTASKSYPLVVGNNTLNFTARYISTSATVVAGAANSTASFTLNYN